MRELQKRLIVSFFVLIITTFVFVGTSFAWFTALLQDEFSGTFGFVEVDLDLYFDNGSGGRIEAEEYVIVPSVTKPGVYNINIVDSNTPNHFEKLRMNVIVKSNIDTYLRVKIYEQLTLKYINFEGVETELSIIIEGVMPFKYELTDWYDNRIIDNYLYLKSKVKRVNETTPLTIGLITQYFPNQNFGNYSVGYSLQIAVSVEAVQYLYGPQNVWGLPQAPWGANW